MSDEVVTGLITIVQEGRFQLAGEDGPKRLFILSHRASTSIDDLQSLERAGRRVAVHYRPTRSLIGYEAKRVVPAEGLLP